MKTLRNMTKVAIIAIATIALASCAKDPGFAGKKAIIGTVTANGVAVAGAEVTIAFNVTEATDVVDYTTVTDATGMYSIEGLNKGDYFVDAYYMDDNGFMYTTGGALVTIGNKKDDLTLDFTLE